MRATSRPLRDRLGCWPGGEPGVPGAATHRAGVAAAWTAEGSPARADTGPGRGSASSPNAGERAYSLIQIIGLLAVLAILAAALVPALMQDIEEKVRRQEAEALSIISGGLRQWIINQRQIPAPGTALSNVAAQVGWPASQVLTNVRGQPRRMLVDPGLQVGTNSAATLPYVQGIYGATNLSQANLRLMLVSSLGEPLPTMLENPGTNAATVFDMVWNATDGLAPAGWTWGGRWEDIVVQRLSLLPLFTRLTLVNAATYMGRFSIDNTNSHVALPSTNFSSFYLVGTVLGLHGDQPKQSGRLQAVQVLQDVGMITNGAPYYLTPIFYYDEGVCQYEENAIWRGRLFAGYSGSKHNGEDLQAAYELFMSGPANVYHTVGSVTQSSLTYKTWLFMSNYVRWTELGFDNSFKNNVLQPSQQAMAAEVSAYCDKKATTGN